MPNHFHLLVKEIQVNGISRFIHDIQSSYARWFNICNQISGPVFMSRFKAKPVYSQEVLLHISRYIHLNPLTSKVVLDPTELNLYEWNSWFEAINYPTKKSMTPLLNLSLLFDLVGNRKKYIKFVLDQSDYQRTLHLIKHYR
jgi:putative transposase